MSKIKILSCIILLVFLGLLGTSLNAQEEETNTPISIEDIKAKAEATDENVSTLLNDVAGLKKIKISGYMQVEFNKSENNAGFGLNPYDSSNATKNAYSDVIKERFRIRRARVKTTFDAGLTQFVLQGDFSNTGFELKDAFMKFTEPWTKYISFQAGVFNRPVYEIEYSSSQRESMERSRVVQNLYPKERDLGAMITVSPDDWFKFQLAAFNNTFKGDLSQFIPNFGGEPFYYMARLTKEFAIPDLGIGIDIGAHVRIGNVVANTNKVIDSDKNKNTKTDINKGDRIGKNWFGFEAQLYFDLPMGFGSGKLLAEYIMGSNVDELTAYPVIDTTTALHAAASAIRKRDFSGFYVMLVKNITDEFQFAVKYDSYNPNTKIVAGDIIDAADLGYSTFGIGIHNYTFDNCRISVWYDINKRVTSSNNIGTVDKPKLLLPDSPSDNLLTVRFQYKF
ncbi:MAG: hypothetical protein QG635_1455 [Bacteroidota bacterium]|nr:hypothetical protein [Bacteroidota bacterium]